MLIPNIKGGNMAAINIGYTLLKAAGWEATGIKHPSDNVPIFKRGEANVRRDVSGQHDWIVSIIFGVWGFDGDIQTFTKEVDKMLERIKE